MGLQQYIIKPRDCCIIILQNGPLELVWEVKENKYLGYSDKTEKGLKGDMK